MDPARWPSSRSLFHNGPAPDSIWRPSDLAFTKPCFSWRHTPDLPQPYDNTAGHSEPDLADRARANLRAWPIASVVTAGREIEPLPSADAIYVNAAATFPHHLWLNALNVDGRLLFPLTPTDETGGMLLVNRVDEARFSARFLCRARFISMVAAQNPTSSRMLSQAFSRGDIGSVRSLRIGTRPDDSAWCIGEGWWLSVEDESTKGARLD